MIKINLLCVLSIFFSKNMFSNFTTYKTLNMLTKQNNENNLLEYSAHRFSSLSQEIQQMTGEAQNVYLLSSHFLLFDLNIGQ